MTESESIRSPDQDDQLTVLSPVDRLPGEGGREEERRRDTHERIRDTRRIAAWTLDDTGSGEREWEPRVLPKGTSTQPFGC